MDKSIHLPGGRVHRANNMPTTQTVDEVERTLKQIRQLPRKEKRQIWRNIWKNRQDAKGKTRAEQRQNWRALWSNRLARPNV